MNRITVHLWYLAIILLLISLVYVISELQGDHTVDARSKELCKDIDNDYMMEVKWDY